MVHNHLIGGGFGRRLELDGVTPPSRSPNRSTDRSRSYGPARKTSSTTCTGRVFDRLSPALMQTESRSRGPIASPAPQSLRGGYRPGSTTVSIPTPRRARSTSSTASPICRWNMCGGTTGHSDCVLAQRRTIAQRLRDREFRRELAAAARQDPVAYRLALLDKTPRAKAVLALAAEKAGWGQPLPRVRAAACPSRAFATYMAHVAEVEVAKNGEVRVRRVVCAVDCGIVVNPDTVRAQIQSAVMFGITAALYGEITLKNGRVEQTNFDSYQMLRMNEAPDVEVHIVQSPSRQAAWAKREPRPSFLPSPTRSLQRLASAAEVAGRYHGRHERDTKNCCDSGGRRCRIQQARRRGRGLVILASAAVPSGAHRIDSSIDVHRRARGQTHRRRSPHRVPQRGSMRPRRAIE